MKTKLILKRLLPCFLIIVGIVMLASCKGCKKDEGTTVNYPSVVPTIANPNDTYIKINNYSIANKTVYYRLLQSYGLSTLNDWVDNIILAGEAFDSHYSDADFNDNMQTIIYGDDFDSLSDDEKAEKLATFEENMRAMGYFQKDGANGWEAYYKLEYKRMNFAVKAFKKFVADHDADEANEEPYFTEDEYKEYYQSNNHANVGLIYVTFDSEAEALKVMAKYGINTNNDKLLGTWEINGVAATSATLLKVFQDMYAEMGHTHATDDLTYEDLSKVSGTIAAKAYTLSTMVEDLNKSYTHGPQLYGSRFYLALKVEQDEMESFEDYYANAENKDEMFHALVENSITTAYISKVLYEERNKLNLKIYDQGVETKYVADYKSAYSTLSITEYDAYATTTEESDKNIATFDFGGTTYTFTAEQMFQAMTNRYGAVLSLLLLQQYVILSNEKYNTVYDYITDTTKDAKKYDTFYASDITSYKTSFEEGTYETNGYPASYGWANFIRDYLGVEDEKSLLSNLDGSLYKAAEDLFSRTFWMTTKEETVENEEGGTDTKVVDDDALIQAEMKKIFEAFFSANIIGLYAYYDTDLDGVADDFGNGKDGTKAKALVDLAYQKAKDSNKETLAEKLAEVVVIYKLADPADATWGEYKKLGIRLAFMSSTSYTNSSSINETLKAKIKEMWQEVYNYADLTEPKLDENGDPVLDAEGNPETVKIGANILGQNLDPGYRYTANSKAYYVTSEKFADKYDSFTIKTSTEEGANDSTAYKIALVKTTAPTYISSSSKTYAPTLANYLAYKEDSTSVSTSIKNAITAYYVPAIENLLKINNVSNAVPSNELYALCKALLSNTTWTVNNATIKAQLEQIIADSTIVAE